MCDFDPPVAFRAVIRTARKPHKCCECVRVVQPGELYEYSSGVWDGRGSSFSTCVTCAKIRDWLLASGYLGDDCGIEVGGLEEACEEALHEWMFTQAPHAEAA